MLRPIHIQQNILSPWPNANPQSEITNLSLPASITSNKHAILVASNMASG